uniref:Amino acid transporter transmembrane domain-containing protein n=1 Tax=Haptolina brevifila TaxID=156173 RepID=A0A7S2IT91_9EUKA
MEPVRALEIPRLSSAQRSRRPVMMTGTEPAKPPLVAAVPPLVAAGSPSPSGASVSTSIINLSKNIVGSGVLALAAGVAAFSSAPIAVVPALALLLFFGAVSGYTFSLIARVGDEVGADTYRDTWAKIFGERLALIPALTVAFKTYVGGLGYSIILGDSFASIATLAGAPSVLCRSNVWIMLLSAFVLLPLSLLRDLSSLAIGSVIGTAGTLYTALFIMFRLFDRSYAVGGQFSAMIGETARPLFAAPSAARPLLNPSVFVLISMLATAFLAHYNAPKYFNELATPTDGTTKQAAFNKVCAGAFGLAAVLCGTIMAGGYLTFGGAAKGLILNSYATSDPLAFCARLGICASVIFSYPLNFVGLREGVLGIVGLKQHAAKTSVHVGSSLILLCAMNGLALKLKDLGLVVAFGGALLGSSLVYIFPALMFIAATRQQMAKGKPISRARRYEMFANYGLVALGAALAGVGGYMSLKNAGAH